MIKDKSFTQQFERESHEEKGVRRIVSVNHIKAVTEKNISTDRKTSRGEVQVFDEIAEEGLQFQPNEAEETGLRIRSLLEEFEARDAIDSDAVYHLSRRLTGLPEANHRD